MWMGRMTFLNRSDQSTRAAVILLDCLENATATVNGETVPAKSVWELFFHVVGLFVGGADDLNPDEYAGAVTAALGSDFALSELEQSDKLAAVLILQSFLDSRSPGGRNG